MADRTETEYAGTVPTRNSVQSLGPNERKLTTSERLRLLKLTGQDEDPEAMPKREIFYGNDREYPDTEIDWTQP